jgi:hypothetical protein
MPWNNNVLSTFSIGQGSFSSGSRANFPLNAAYVHLTSGAALALRFRAPVTQPLQEFYAFLDSTTGTRANISLRCRLYQDNNAANELRPSSTLIATATDALLPASDDRWIRWEFPTPPTVTANENYWLIIDNLAVAPATDFPSILTGQNFRTINRANNNEYLFGGFSTTTGYSGNGSSAGGFFVCVLNGVPYGNPFTLSVSPYTSNTLRHGALFSKALEAFRYSSPQADGVASTANLFEIHDASLAVGSGILYSSAVPTGNVDRTGGGVLLSPPAEVSGANEYVVSFRSTSVTTSPSGISIEGYSDYPAMFDQFFDGVITCKAIQEVAGAWQVIPGVMSRIQMMIESIKPSSGSSPQPFMRGTAF